MEEKLEILMGLSMVGRMKKKMFGFQLAQTVMAALIGMLSIQMEVMRMFSQVAKQEDSDEQSQKHSCL